MKMKNVATEEIENTSQFPERFVDEEEEASLELMDDEFFNQSKNSGSIVTPWYDKDSVSSFEEDDDDEDNNDVADFDVVGTMMPAAVDCGDENIIPIEEIMHREQCIRCRCSCAEQFIEGICIWQIASRSCEKFKNSRYSTAFVTCIGIDFK